MFEWFKDNKEENHTYDIDSELSDLRARIQQGTVIEDDQDLILFVLASAIERGDL